MQLGVKMSFSWDTFDIAYLIGGKIVHEFPFAII